MTKKMKRFTVRRSEWVRGGQNGNDPDNFGEGELLNDEGFMCCLGFAACQISRIPKRELRGAGMPDDVFKTTSFLTNRLEDGCVENNKLADRAAAINDSWDMTDKTREKKLTKLFREYGIILKFVD